MSVETQRFERRAAIPDFEVGRKMDQFGAAHRRLENLAEQLGDPITNRIALRDYPGIVGKIAEALPGTAPETYSLAELRALASLTSLSKRVQRSANRLPRHARKFITAPAQLERKYLDTISHNPHIPLDRKDQMKAIKERHEERVIEIGNNTRTPEGVAIILRTQNPNMLISRPDRISSTLATMLEQLDPESPTLLNYKGRKLMSTDPTSAKELFRASLEKNPLYLSPYLNLGILLYEAGDKEGARTHWEKALELDPESSVAHSDLGIFHDNEGNKKEARAYYQKALELDPENFHAHYNLGLLLHEEGDNEGARAYYEEALRLNPEYTAAHNNLGNLLFHEGDNKEARIHYYKALELDPEISLVHNNLGNLLFEEGDNEGARAYWEKALELDPENSTAKLSIERLATKRKRLRGLFHF